MSAARGGIDLMQTNRSILIRGSYAGIGDYVALTKPRVMSLVVFTALVGLMVAPGGIDPFAGLVALVCIAAGSIGFRTDARHVRRSKPRHFPEYGRGCPACFHNFLLCRRLHDVAQT